jgi:hypothetical protein
MQLSVPCLDCKDCGKSTPLPSPEHPGKPEKQSFWPADGLPRNFQCPHCKRVREYSVQDVHHHLLDDKALGRLQHGYGVVSYDVPCDEHRCKGFVEIHVVMSLEANLSAEVPALISGSIAHDLRCTEGHRKFGQNTDEHANDARYDEEWTTRS